MTITTRTLKIKEFKFADGSEKVERFAVLKNNVRIGTIHKVTCDNSVFFDSFKLTPGHCGDGKIISVNFLTQRKFNINAALQLFSN